jgi:hypothetical protein
MKLNMNQRIRAHLESLNTPVFPMAVALALGEKPHRVRNAMANMKDAGLILYDKATGYSKGGRKPLSRAEAAVLGGHARAAKAVAKPYKPKSIPITPRKLGVTEMAAVRETFPDTDAFIRDNPDKVIRIEPGRWSTDLRFQY